MFIQIYNDYLLNGWLSPRSLVRVPSTRWISPLSMRVKPRACFHVEARFIHQVDALRSVPIQMTQSTKVRTWLTF